MAVRGSDRLLRRHGLALRAAAGQAVVHAALALANPCTSHPGASDQSHVLPALDVVMTGAHVGALLLCVTVAAHVERRITGLVTQVACWVRAVVGQRPLQVTSRRREMLGRQREGFFPTQREQGSCGTTRGPPPRFNRPRACLS